MDAQNYFALRGPLEQARHNVYALLLAQRGNEGAGIQNIDFFHRSSSFSSVFCRAKASLAGSPPGSGKSASIPIKENILFSVRDCAGCKVMVWPSMRTKTFPCGKISKKILGKADAFITISLIC